VTAPASKPAASIEQLLDDLLKVEGGYSNNPADRGGPTNFGITEHVARAHGYGGDMRSLPRSTALAIYREDYWSRPGFEAVAQRMPSLAAELFDTGVNMGPKTASIFLQRALNVLNRGATDYPDISADGDIGKMTLFAIDQLKAKRANAEIMLRRAVDCLQGARYIEIAEKNPKQEAFEAGWLSNRIGGA
jgi:lysozyme family protein